MDTTTPMPNTTMTAANAANSWLRREEVMRRMGRPWKSSLVPEGSVGGARSGSQQVIGARAADLEPPGGAECGDGARLLAPVLRGRGPVIVALAIIAAVVVVDILIAADRVAVTSLMIAAPLLCGVTASAATTLRIGALSVLAAAVAFIWGPSSDHLALLDPAGGGHGRLGVRRGDGPLPLDRGSRRGADARARRGRRDRPRGPAGGGDRSGGGRRAVPARGRPVRDRHRRPGGQAAAGWRAQRRALPTRRESCWAARCREAGRGPAAGHHRAPADAQRRRRPSPWARRRGAASARRACDRVGDHGAAGAARRAAGSPDAGDAAAAPAAVARAKTSSTPRRWRAAWAWRWTTRSCRRSSRPPSSNST